MELKYSREIRVPLSACGPDGRLALPAVFRLFMDLAAEHAELLGTGIDALAAGDLFWLAVRTQVRLFRLPGLLEKAALTTWPEKPGAARCCRSYTITAGGELLAAGRTEWAVINTATGRLVPMTAVYTPELTARLTDETALPGAFSRIGETFAPGERLGIYTVRPTDIDLGGHMNNSAYARMVMDAVPLSEQRERPVREMELCYRAPCYEGQELSLFRRETEDGWEMGVFLPDGKTALLAKAVL